MKRLLLVATTVAAVGLTLPGADGAHRRTWRRAEPADEGRGGISAERRPLQTEGADGTVSTGAWKTVSSSKAGSNVLIAEGVDHEAAVAEHQAFLASADAKAHNVFHTSYQIPYAPARSHPDGARVGQAYTEFFMPKTSGPADPPTFQPPIVKTGYFKQRNQALAQQKQAEKDAAKRKERIRARIGVCTLCDNAVSAGRTIVQNELHKDPVISNQDLVQGAEHSTATARTDSKGLVTLVKTTCELMTQNYHSEVLHLDCDKVSDDISKYYDAKFEGNVRSAGKIIEQVGAQYKIRGPSRRVNFALTAALQSCDTLFGITFCDADAKPLAPAAEAPHSSISQPVPIVAAAVPTTAPEPDAINTKLSVPSSPDQMATALSATSAETAAGTLSAMTSRPVIAALGAEPTPAGGCDTSVPDCQPGAVVDASASINDPLPIPPKSYSTNLTVAATSEPGSKPACVCDCCLNEPECDCASTEAAPGAIEAKLALFLEGVMATELNDDITRSLKHMLSALLMLDDTLITIRTPSSSDDVNVLGSVSGSRHEMIPEIVEPTATGPSDSKEWDGKEAVTLVPHVATGPSDGVGTSAMIISSISPTGTAGATGADDWLPVSAEETPDIVQPVTVLSASVPTVTAGVSIKSKRRRLLLGAVSEYLPLKVVVQCDSKAHVKVVEERWRDLCGEKLKAAVQLILPAVTSVTCEGTVAPDKSVEEDSPVEDEEVNDPTNRGKFLNESSAPLQDEEEENEERNATLTVKDDEEDDVSEDEDVSDGEDDEDDEDASDGEDEEDASEDNVAVDGKISESGSTKNDEDDEDSNEGKDADDERDSKSGSAKKDENATSAVKDKDDVDANEGEDSEDATEDEDNEDVSVGEDEEAESVSESGAKKVLSATNDTESSGKKKEETDSEDLEAFDEDVGGGEGVKGGVDGEKRNASENDEAEEIENEMDTLDESIASMSETLAKENADAEKETGAAKEESLKEVEEVTDRLEKAKKALEELSGDAKEDSEEDGGTMDKEGKDDAIASENKKDSHRKIESYKSQDGHVSEEKSVNSEREKEEDEVEKVKTKKRGATPQFRSKSVSLRGATEPKKPEKKQQPFFLPHADVSGEISLDEVLKANGI